MPEIYNVAQSLAEMAATAPFRPAIFFPAGRDAEGRAKYVQLNFRQLDEESNRYAHGLSALGIGLGDRVLLLLHPGVEFIAVVFALLKMGSVPVLIDPGMGRRAFLRCIADAAPQAMIALPIAHALRRVAPRPFTSITHTIIVGEVPFIGTALTRALGETTLARVRSEYYTSFPIAQTTTEDEAAIAFTSGSTGIPKGVVYEHGMFKAQIELLRDAIGIEPGEVDLALLYVFALFNPALGVTTVVPDMDPTKSAEVNPAYIVEAVQTHGVTNAFGSPTIWRRVAPYCVQHGIKLPSLRRIIMAGAPVPPELIKTLLTQVLGPEAEILTPYGATEAMPLTTIEGREILQEAAKATEAGKGMCVGRPLPGIHIQVIGITDDPIPQWDEKALALPACEIGEIVVKGPVVTRTYLNRPQQTRMAKIVDGDEVWHRMGDLGYFDAQGRLWFCGRKSHRVETPEGTLFPVLCEAIFNQHPDVLRTALVGLGPRGRQQPVLVVEMRPGKFPRSVLARQRLTMELLALGAVHPHTRSIQQLLFYPNVFPTDIRHNAKIQREKLAVWAAGKLRIRQGPAKIAPSPGLVEDVSYTGASPHRSLGRHLRIFGLIASIGVSLWLVMKRLHRHNTQPPHGSKHSSSGVETSDE